MMCKAMEELVNERTKRVREDIAERLIAAGKFTVDEIAEYSGLAFAEVEMLAALKC